MFFSHRFSQNTVFVAMLFTSLPVPNRFVILDDLDILSVSLVLSFAHNGVQFLELN